jgi:hypothetical protein
MTPLWRKSAADFLSFLPPGICPLRSGISSGFPGIWFLAHSSASRLGFPVFMQSISSNRITEFGGALWIDWPPNSSTQPRINPASQNRNQTTNSLISYSDNIFANDKIVLVYFPISTSSNVLSTDLGRGFGFFAVGVTGSFCSVPIKKTWCVFGSSAMVRAP